MFFHLMLTNTLWGRYYHYQHFIQGRIHNLFKVTELVSCRAWIQNQAACLQAGLLTTIWCTLQILVGELRMQSILHIAFVRQQMLRMVLAYFLFPRLKVFPKYDWPLSHLRSSPGKVLWITWMGEKKGPAWPIFFPSFLPWDGICL